MKWKQLFLVVAVSAFSAVGSVWVYGKLNKSGNSSFSLENGTKLPVNYAHYVENGGNGETLTDFTKAAAAAVPAVVHIKTKIPAKKISNNLPNSRGGNGGGGFDDFFDQFFNYGPQIQPEQRASGSGVIISEDGYIVTNNHVVSDGKDGVADEITVTLNENKKTYKARLVDRDPSSDLAVLKIDGTGFPYMLYGNSDDTKLGQWVLAVGYPLTLEATVTAGIISAKGRTIGINSRQSNSPVEYFIQTDAAVNQGNSGGALINTDGKLIGINSAILAPNGTYAGYSFAIPVNLVKKIVNDLIEFGKVQRGYLGISYPTSDNEGYIKRAGVKEGGGVYVQAVPTDGAAYKAGLKRGDVITKVNGNRVASGLEMSGQIASYKPGDKVKITYFRDGQEKTTDVALGAEVSKIEIVASDILTERLGGEFENVDSKTATKYDLNGGVVVKKVDKGGLLDRSRISDGFVITSINRYAIKNMDVLANYVAQASGNTIQLEGFYPGSGGTYRYPVNLGEDESEY